MTLVLTIHKYSGPVQLAANLPHFNNIVFRDAPKRTIVHPIKWSKTFEGFNEPLLKESILAQHNDRNVYNSALDPT